MKIATIVGYAAVALAASAWAVGCSSPAVPSSPNNWTPPAATSAAFVANCDRGLVDQDVPDGYRWRMQVSCRIEESAGVGADMTFAVLGVTPGDYGIPVLERVYLNKTAIANQSGTAHWNAREVRSIVLTFLIKGDSAGLGVGKAPFDALDFDFEDEHANFAHAFVEVPFCYQAGLSLTPGCS